MSSSNVVIPEKSPVVLPVVNKHTTKEKVILIAAIVCTLIALASLIYFSYSCAVNNSISLPSSIALASACLSMSAALGLFFARHELQAKKKSLIPSNLTKDLPLTKPDEPLTKPDEPLTKPDEPLTKPDEPLSKPDEPLSKPDEPLPKQDEPLPKQDEPLTKPDEALPKQDESTSASSRKQSTSSTTSVKPLTIEQNINLKANPDNVFDIIQTSIPIKDAVKALKLNVAELKQFKSLLQEIKILQNDSKISEMCILMSILKHHLSIETPVNIDIIKTKSKTLVNISNSQTSKCILLNNLKEIDIKLIQTSCFCCLKDSPYLEQIVLTEETTNRSFYVKMKNSEPCTASCLSSIKEFTTLNNDLDKLLQSEKLNLSPYTHLSTLISSVLKSASLPQDQQLKAQLSIAQNLTINELFSILIELKSYLQKSNPDNLMRFFNYISGFAALYHINHDDMSIQTSDSSAIIHGSLPVVIENNEAFLDLSKIPSSLRKSTAFSTLMLPFLAQMQGDNSKIKLHQSWVSYDSSNPDSLDAYIPKLMIEIYELLTSDSSVGPITQHSVMQKLLKSKVKPIGIVEEILSHSHPITIISTTTT